MNFDELELPDHWMLTPIAEVFDFTSKPKGLDLSQFGDTVPFIPMELVPIGRITATKSTPRLQADLGSGTYVEDGDLMVAKITPSFENGKQGILQIGEPFAFGSTEVIPVHGREGISETRYLFFYLLHPEIRSSLAGKMEGSTGRQRLSKAVLGDCLIPLPPLAKQKEIIQTLSAVQRAIEAQERIIQTSTELKQALMQKLFSEGLRGEPQKETEIGLVPESWEVCTVGDVAMIQSGGTPSRENPNNWIGGTIPWVKTGEINYRTIIDTEEKITQHGLNNSSARIFPEGTLLMAMYGQGITRGRVGILGIEAATNQACAAIIPKRKEEVVTKYLYFYFQHSYESLRRMGHGANQKNMNADLIRAFPLALPSPEEQEEVTSIMKTHDDRLEQANLKRLCLTDLFASLLHDLMGGRFLLSSNEQSC